jgi:hypothetical protein
MSSDDVLNESNPFLDEVQWFLRGRKLSRRQVASLEKQLAKDPTNIEVRLLLLRYHFRPDRDERYCDLLEWFIENEPLHFLHTHSCVFKKSKSFQRCKKLWIRQVEANPGNTRILRNLAQFCKFADPRTSVKYLKLAHELEPESQDISLELSDIYKRIAEDGSKTNAQRAVLQMRKTVAIYENSDPAVHSYFHQYFECTLQDYADLAFEFGLFDDAEFFGNSLFDIKTLDSKRKGIAVAENKYSYYRQRTRGYSIVGRVALARGDVEKAVSSLWQMCDIQSSFFFEWGLANDLLKARQKKVVLEYLERLVAKEPGEERLEQIHDWIEQIKKGRRPKLD